MDDDVARPEQLAVNDTTSKSYGAMRIITGTASP